MNRHNTSKRSTMKSTSFFVLMIVFATAGCGERRNLGTGTPEHDKMVSQAMDDMLRPSRTTDEPAIKGWPVIDDEQQSLEKLTQHIREVFEEYDEVDKLIY